jgi:mannose-1-phosphate guanylyltransferase
MIKIEKNKNIFKKGRVCMLDYSVKIGLVPMRRNTTDRPKGTFLTWYSAEQRGERFVKYIEENFAANPSISIDYSILEKSKNICCVDGSFYWNDLGSWSSLFELDVPDAGGNVSRGKNILVDTRHCVVCGDDSTLIGVVGMRDVAIIKSGNGVLVCPLSEEQRVREIIKAATGNPEYDGFI